MHWSENEMALSTEVTFRNQTDLADFVLAIARRSDAFGHHADMEIRYNVLRMHLSTHDAGHRVTGKDYQLKQIIEEELQQRTP